MANDPTPATIFTQTPTISIDITRIIHEALSSSTGASVDDITTRRANARRPFSNMP